MWAGGGSSLGKWRVEQWQTRRGSAAAVDGPACPALRGSEEGQPFGARLSNQGGTAKEFSPLGESFFIVRPAWAMPFGHREFRAAVFEQGQRG